MGTDNVFGLQDDEDAVEIVDAFDDGDENEGDTGGDDDGAGPENDGTTDVDNAGSSTADTDPESETGAEPPPQPTAPETPETPGPPPESEPDREPPAGSLLAGRFASPADLERGYGELRTLQNRTALRAQELEAEVARRDDYLRRILPALEQARSPQQAAPPTVQIDPNVLRAAQEAGLPEEALPVLTQLADQIAAQRVGEVRSELQVREAQTQQQAAASSESAIVDRTLADFFARHPDVVRGGEEDEAIGRVVFDLDLRLDDPEALDIALEVARDEDLHRVIVANPHFVDTDEGMDFARAQAAELRTRRTAAGNGNGATPPATPDPQAAAAAAHTAAHVETRSTTPAPAAVDSADDIWAKALKLAEAERGSPLGV
jgi:hypothetical protein